MEVNKKREAELQRLRRDLEETTVQSDALIASLRKRHGDGMTELGEQCESLQRTRAKLEKEKQNLRMEVEDMSSALDTLQKAKTSADVQAKKLEEQLSDACSRGDDLQRALTEVNVARNRLADDLQRALTEVNVARNRLAVENADLSRQLEEVEGRACQLTRSKSLVHTKHEELRRSMDEEVKKLMTRLQEAEEAAEATQSKCSSLEKTKQRLQGEVEELCMNLEKASGMGQALDKKQRILEKQLGDWRQKSDELVAEVEGCQKESRQHAGELFKLKSAHEEALEQLEALRRENKAHQGNGRPSV
ncbi:hypothetical protein CRUP_023481 [Coryphaenoides rupestris]|nr:hypothetical protein CRUP_023481 [Coryphaenoides rupestris]